MKGIILAGGNGRRLKPLTDVTNKHLLPVYDRPMIFYPLETLTSAGIREILVVTGKEYSNHFIKLLGDGKNFGCHLTFAIQESALGIAHALGLAKNFAGKDSIAVILGDNIFEDPISPFVKGFSGAGAHVFLKETNEANRFGVAEIRENRVIGIEEKPKKPASDLAVTGLYLYDNNVFEIIKTLKPSARGELEITDVNNFYVKENKMSFTVLDGNWTDCGTFESLFKACEQARLCHCEPR